MAPLGVVCKPLSASACPAGELIKPGCVLVIPQCVTRLLVSQVAVGRRRLFVRGNDRAHQLHGLVRRVNQLSAQGCGGVGDGAGVRDVLLR